MLSEEHKPCWKCEKQMQRELSSALVVPCRNLDSQRNEGADRARRPDILGIVSWTSLVIEKSHLWTTTSTFKKKTTSSSLLPMLFGGQRKRVSPTQMTQQERGVSSFSKLLGPRRFAETRFDGNRALKWDEIPREKGPGELVRPQSTSTLCSSMLERISHTQSTEFMRISRWPSRWLSKSKRAVHLRLHSAGSNIMVHAEEWRTTEGNNEAVVIVEFVVDTLVIWTPRTANCPL